MPAAAVPMSKFRLMNSVFWQLHVMPGKIAAKRHHPQKDAIHVLRLLLLAFGGLL